MLEKIQDVLTTQKNRKMFRIALTAANRASHTEFVLTAGFMQDALSFTLALIKVCAGAGKV